MSYTVWNNCVAIMTMEKTVQFYNIFLWQATCLRSIVGCSCWFRRIPHIPGTQIIQKLKLVIVKSIRQWSHDQTMSISSATNKWAQFKSMNSRVRNLFFSTDTVSDGSLNRKFSYRHKKSLFSSLAHLQISRTKCFESMLWFIQRDMCVYLFLLVMSTSIEKYW